MGPRLPRVLQDVRRIHSAAQPCHRVQQPWGPPFTWRPTNDHGDSSIGRKATSCQSPCPKQLSPWLGPGHDQAHLDPVSGVSWDHSASAASLSFVTSHWVAVFTLHHGCGFCPPIGLSRLWSHAASPRAFTSTSDLSTGPASSRQRAGSTEAADRSAVPARAQRGL